MTNRSNVGVSVLASKEESQSNIKFTITQQKNNLNAAQEGSLLLDSLKIQIKLDPDGKAKADPNVVKNAKVKIGQVKITISSIQPK